ncbi:SENP2 [Branchiostoma lanceolatum]|uniref:SENP2 protein n=1 Tax=Branchiostoma lanceolatum TaxID=7740 RepID=A0A8J9Z5B8_BRALA|nr:SENP2 [Branchiostoma lanceolatum]
MYLASVKDELSSMMQEMTSHAPHDQALPLRSPKKRKREIIPDNLHCLPTFPPKHPFTKRVGHHAEEMRSTLQVNISVERGEKAPKLEDCELETVIDSILEYETVLDSTLEAEAVVDPVVAAVAPAAVVDPVEVAVDPVAVSEPQHNPIVANGFGYDLRKNDVRSLQGNNWLNDRIINVYMKLIVDRGNRLGPLKLLSMDTFFYTELMRYGSRSPETMQWSREFDLSRDLIFVPVHLGNHWCLANIPKQRNCYDCGVFCCKFAQYRCSQNGIMNFTQDDMPRFRRQMEWEILHQQLL